MSRANVANSPVGTGEWRYFAFIRPIKAFSSEDLEKLIRWAMPTALVVFISALIAVSFSTFSNQQDRTVAAATTEMQLVATVIARNIELGLHSQPKESRTTLLSRAIPAYAFHQGQQVLLSDRTGRVLASYPPSRLGSLAELRGADQSIPVLSDDTGAMRLALQDGTDALAIFRSLPNELGQIAIVHPVVSVLRAWKETVDRVVFWMCCLAAMLSGLAMAYFWQETKARRAGSSCRQMRDHVDMVLARGRFGLWDWDLASGAIHWSASMYQIIGMAPRRVMSCADVERLLHPSDGGLAAMTKTLRHSGSNMIEHVFRMRGASDAWIWLRAKAEIVRHATGEVHFVGIVTDISDTMALRERTAKADIRLRDAIEAISEAFVVWDADNKLVMCNSKFQRFHNLPGDAVALGTPYPEVMERGTPPLVQQVAIGQDQPMGARTFEAQLADGRWLQINERRTKDGGYVSVGTDITTLKRNEEQLIESERRLRLSVLDLRKSQQELEARSQELVELASEAEKANRAKSDFLANMSHELRTPLNAILGFSEIMSLEAFGALGSPHYREYAKDIHSSGRYLFGMIADVLEMSRLDAGRVRLEKAEFEIREAIDAAISSVAKVAEANRLSIAVQTDDALLHADRAAVEKILTILLNNAVKYTPSTGAVTVRSHTSRSETRLCIEDTGVGIPPEAIARLGRPFEQSDQPLNNGMRGSGLGLAIARSLVELHGGSMSISSREGSGTAVLVRLPCRPPVPKPKLQLASSADYPPSELARSSARPPARILRKRSLTA